MVTLFLAGVSYLLLFLVPRAECPFNAYCIDYFAMFTFAFTGFALLFFIFSLILFFIAKLVEIKPLVIVLIAFVLSAIPTVYLLTVVL